MPADLFALFQFGDLARAKAPMTRKRAGESGGGDPFFRGALM